MTQDTDALIPQRPARTNALAETLTTQTGTTVPETDIHDTDTTQDEAPALDMSIAEADPYAQVETDGRPRDFVRQPFGEPRLRLQAPGRPGFRRYWFNNEPGRIQRAVDAGYSFVKVRGQNTRAVVGRAKQGGAQVAYLMEIPQDWFAQDVRRQQAKVDEIDAAIKSGNVGAKPGELTKDGDNRYVPKDAIRYDPQATRAEP